MLQPLSLLALMLGCTCLSFSVFNCFMESRKPNMLHEHV